MSDSGDGGIIFPPAPRSPSGSQPSSVAGRKPAYRDRVIRRQPRPTQVIICPPPERARNAPSTRGNARAIAGGLIAIIMLGALLLASPWTSASGEPTPFIDALFIAVSAICVTGLVTLDTGTHWNTFGQAVIVSLIYLGGLGFMTGASILFVFLRRGGSLRDSLLLRDAAGTPSLREAKRLSRQIFIFINVVEGTGALALGGYFWLVEGRAFGEALWRGIFYSVSAFCNAGFDLEGNFASLAGYRDSIPMNLMIGVLLQFGALSYILFHDLWANRRRSWIPFNWARLGLDSKLIIIMHGILVLIGVVVFLGAEWNNGLAGQSTGLKFMSAIFQSISGRTAGFSTVDIGTLHIATLFTWLVVMAIGGAPASTAGGVKMTTVGVIVTGVLSAMRGQEEPQIFGRRLASILIFRAMAVVVLFAAMHFVATVLLAFTEDAVGDAGFGLIQIMFEAMSGLATVGLSTGITPELTSAGKTVMCVAMICGRLGPLTIAYALQLRQNKPRYRYPETLVRIG